MYTDDHQDWVPPNVGGGTDNPSLTWTGGWLDASQITPGHRVVRKTSDLIEPAPCRTFVLLDERDDSINDAFFVTDMRGFDPRQPSAWAVIDYPSSYHNGAGGLNFADGYSEIKRWRDPRTHPLHQKDCHLPLRNPGRACPDNPDLLWLMEHASSRQR